MKYLMAAVAITVMTFLSLGSEASQVTQPVATFTPAITEYSDKIRLERSDLNRFSYDKIRRYIQIWEKAAEKQFENDPDALLNEYKAILSHTKTHPQLTWRYYRRAKSLIETK